MDLVVRLISAILSKVIVPSILVPYLYKRYPVIPVIVIAKSDNMKSSLDITIIAQPKQLDYEHLLNSCVFTVPYSYLENVPYYFRRSKYQARIDTKLVKIQVKRIPSQLPEPIHSSSLQPAISER